MTIFSSASFDALEAPSPPVCVAGTGPDSSICRCRSFRTSSGVMGLLDEAIACATLVCNGGRVCRICVGPRGEGDDVSGLDSAFCDEERVWLVTGDRGDFGR